MDMLNPIRRAFAAVVLALGLAPACIAQAAETPCDRRAFEGASFTVCPFDSTKHDLALAWKGADGKALRTFAAAKQALGSDASRVRFAMNAGMYGVSGAPVGLYAGKDGQRPINTKSGAGNFFLKPNGVFSMDARSDMRVETTDAYVAAKRKPVLSTQSGPMLVIGGALHPSIQPDGLSRLIRNGVGVANAKAAYFVVSDNPVSFGKLARFFRDELGCPDALYLDGVVSSLWLPSTGRMDSAHNLGPMLVVLDRR
jgi:uncharacterized protein YigE (DUF2233 family)